jgi:hypothetical protein
LQLVTAFLRHCVLRAPDRHRAVLTIMIHGARFTHGVSSHLVIAVCPRRTFFTCGSSFQWVVRAHGTHSHDAIHTKCTTCT